MASPKQLDRDWVRRSFLVSKTNKDAMELKRRFYSSASVKYVDTSPGGNVMINPPPQFTRLADVKPKSIRSSTNPLVGSSGLLGEGNDSNMTTTLGRYYSEAIDDNAHLVHFRMGKTGYNSFLHYLFGFYSYKAGYIARTGRAPGFFYNVGRVAGAVTAIVNWRFVATLFLVRMLKFMTGVPSFRYAYLKPAMPVYWAAVQSMVNHIATYQGLTTIGTSEALQQGNKLENNDGYTGFDMDAQTRARLHEMMPDIYDAHGNINVYGIATKSARRANAMREAVRHALDAKNIKEGTRGFNQSVVELMSKTYGVTSSGGLTSLIDHWLQQKGGGAYTQTGNIGGMEMRSDNLSDPTGLGEYLAAELRDGSAFVTFRVDEGGSVSESFSNTAADSELKSKLDGLASNVRSTMNMWAGGNISDGPLGTAVQGILGSVAQVIGGGLDSFGLGGLAMIGGGGYADIPQHWESSMASMPRANYTIKLRAPYRNPYSVLVNETIPLCMLLAMVLPNSTGMQSYTGPFMLEFYDTGRAMSRYGMVDSISITRGTASTAFNQERMYHGIEVSLSILDLTNQIHMPLSEGFSSITAGNTNTHMAAGVVGTVATGSTEGGFDLTKAIGAIETAGDAIGSFWSDDTNFTDYMAILSGLGVADNIYATRKARLRLTRAFAEWRTHYSKPALAMAYGDSWVGQLAKIPYRGSDKLF